MEQVRLASEDILPYMLAGKATITIRNPKTDKSFTYKVEKPKDCDKWFVKVLTGPNNDHSSNYTYIGFISRGHFLYGVRSRISHVSPCVKAFGWFMGNLKSLGCVEVYRSTRCGRCGRKLTVVNSILALLGPECQKYVNVG